ncbi:MAG: energy transducer TonB [Halobacteriovoraceae bacterium]|nr:energy transducer TonB [Halobacteriovoraceae bacterium]
MKSLLLSLSIHLMILFALNPDWISLKETIQPKITGSEQVFHVSIQLNEKEIQTLQKTLKKVSTKKLNKTKKKIVKKQVQKKAVISREKVTKVDGQEVLNKYFAELRKFIEKKKYYPKRAIRMRQAGSVEICLEIDEHGHFHAIKIKNPSQFKTLNKAALALVKEISRFKPLPKEMGEKVTLNIPLKYALKN